MLVCIAVDVSGAICYNVFIMLSPFVTLMVTAHQGPYSVELVSGESDSAPQWHYLSSDRSRTGTASTSEAIAK